ncbi:NADH-quinone oxidoreductase subunit K [bacterium]|nr:NADH-quinone oxidoreductase subunit K [bacterium]
MFEITMYHYLFLGLLIFVIGLTGSILSKHVIKVLISIEFILTGVI